VPDALLAELLTLLAQPSVSGSEASLAVGLAAWAQNNGFASQVQHVGPGRASALVELDAGSGPHVLFSAHIDTLPPPHVPTVAGRHGDRFYAPEVNNMKAALAAMLAAMVRLRASEIRGRVTLLAAASECDTIGLGTVAALQHGLHADAAINGEPTDLRILLGHAGVARLRMVARGRHAHVSQVDDVDNAISHLVRALAGLDATVLGTTPSDRFPGLPVLNTGLIEGGIAASISAPTAQAHVDIRYPPGESLAGLLDAVRAHVQASGESDHVSVEALAAPEFLQPGPFVSDPGSDVVAAVAAAHANVTGHPCEQDYLFPQIYFGSDAPHLVAAGIPTCMYGPGRLEDINSKNESVRWDDVRIATEVYEQAVRRVLR
jgi:acetylornithine deacetylase/succinyl-diaminopimelate desuccinylase-like protein